jgi:hypothetical protein
MNPMNAIKYLSLLNKFKENHPKLPKFIKAAGMIADAGTVAEITVTTSAGKKITANVKLTEEDIKLLGEIKELREKQM